MYKVGNHLCMKEPFISSLQRPGMSFMLRQIMFEEENAEHLQISLISTFFYNHYFSASFFFFPSKIVQSTRTPVLLPDRHLILSDSIRKPGTVTPQFSKASKTVYLLESRILEFCASLLYQRIITEVNLSPSELWCFW